MCIYKPFSEYVLELGISMAMESSMRALNNLSVGLIIHLAAIVSFCMASSTMACHESERQALLKFKRGLVDNSTRLQSWAMDDDCCGWPGVICDNITGRVRELHLRNPIDPYVENVKALDLYLRSRLGGEVDASLMELKHLTYLDLSGNDFGGIRIPSFFGDMGSLRYLDLSRTGFEGRVPHQLGNLSNLIYLNLQTESDYHPLDVDNFQWVSNLLLLEHLDMSGANLGGVGDWLQVTSSLPSLKELHLSGCHLDHMPLSISPNFTSLVIFDLSDNGFSSPLIPAWVFDLKTLFHLDLSRNYFGGPLPIGLRNMTSLKHLDLSSNMFNSSIPDWLHGLSDLQHLDLSFNQFQGTISNAIGNLTRLIHLDLSSNQFNSFIPDWLHGLSHLQYLSLSDNQFQGKISNAIGNSTRLMHLELRQNKLEGPLPRFLGSLCSLRFIGLSGNPLSQDISQVLKTLSLGCVSNGLEILYLSDCQLFGPFPKFLRSLQSLRNLVLSNNRLNGSIPKWIGQLSNLKGLSLEKNSLEGAVSEVHFANLTALQSLSLSENRKILEVSRDWVPPFSLHSILLSSCHLGPSFPSWLRFQSDLSTIDISNNGIRDTIPNWFWNSFSNIVLSNLSHNQLQGGISHMSLSNTLVIDLSYNSMRGHLPAGLSSSVKQLNLSNNSISGSISHLLCDLMDGPKNLEILHLGDNLLSGEIPDCWMNRPNLVSINLQGNNLTGKIPGSMGSLRFLRSLHLSKNDLSGALPSSLRYCKKLQVLDLGENKLVGQIPSWIGDRLAELKMLKLHSNRFGSHIPEELCRLRSLQVLDLAHNNLSGRIPKCFSNLTAMAADQKKLMTNQKLEYSIFVEGPIDSLSLVTKGREDEYGTILGLVTSIDFSSNSLSGEIPTEITSLFGLRWLNLSRNLLNGRIPAKIGDMGSLESLDLSRNHLDGEIPPSMSQLTFLSYLDLSYNNLVGKIPSSTQFQSFDPSRFVGNHLCGLPLLKTCPEPHVREEEEGRKDDDEGREVNYWFYVGMAMGFIVSFWIVMGPLAHCYGC